MLKNISIVILVFASIHFSSAQDKKFGIIGGANYSTLFGDIRDNPNFEIDRRLSFHAGFFADFQLSDKFSFSPRILYSSQGYKSSGDLSDFGVEPIPSPSEFENFIQYNYLNLPMVFSFTLANEIHLNFGPQAGFLLNTVSKFEGDGEEERSSANGDFKLDYGGLLGVSYNFSDEFFIELNYYQGISNISRNPDFRFESTNNNSVFQLSLGYLLF